MEYNDLKINLEENKSDIIKAFTIVLGEENKEDITNCINDVILIDFITSGQYKYYLESCNIDPNTNEDYLKDKYQAEKVKKYYADQFIRELSKLIPDNKTIQSEFEKSINNDYVTPLFNNLNGNRIEVTKLIILEDLGYNHNIHEPYILHQNENNIIINRLWDSLFSKTETDIIRQLVNKYYYEDMYERTLSTGNIKEKQELYNSKKIISDGGFDYKEIAFCPMSRYVSTGISSENGKLVPILVFCPLFSPNKDTLLSFIHELTHVISMKMFEESNKIRIKKGVKEVIFTKGVNFVDEEAILKDNPNYYYEEKNRQYLNEAMTQYIATLVTKIILDYNLCDSLFSFTLPKQEARFESSYVNLMLCFKDFFDKNFDDVKNCYMGNYIIEKIGNVSFEQLVEYANEAFGDETKINIIIDNLNNIQNHI